MADWMSQMANAVDEAEAANALPHEEVPTEPAITLRSQIHDAPGSTRIVEELQLPSLEYGPRPEPERFATRYILNDGSMPQEEYEELMRKAAQPFNNRDMEIERQQAEAAEHEAHQRSIEEWEAKVKTRELDNAALPCGPTPQGTSSMRVLPNVHEALRQNDPKMTSLNQSSRRLHLHWAVHGHQRSTLMQSLQGLVQYFNLHHLQNHDQLLFQVLNFHWQRLR